MQRSENLERELERCHIELQAALDAVPIGIVLADANDGTVIVVNPKAYDIFGGRVFPGQKLMEYLHLNLLHLDETRIPPNDFPLARAIERGEHTEAHDILFE